MQSQAMLSHYFVSCLRYANRVLQNLVPRVCLLCQSETRTSIDLCEACQAELPYLENPCIHCALPLSTESTDQLCGDCLQKKCLAPYRIFSPFTYEFPIDRLIMALKFKNQLITATVLGQLMAHHMKKTYQNQKKPSIIIPVPLHPHRLRERGFNQALELARPIHTALMIPLDYRSCSRIRPTQPQIHLSATARASNVKNSFSIASGFRAAHVCIIDDVLTTGHTSFALSDALFKAGVQSIDIWCCARANLKTSKDT